MAEGKRKPLGRMLHQYFVLHSPRGFQHVRSGPEGKRPGRSILELLVPDYCPALTYLLRGTIASRTRLTRPGFRLYPQSMESETRGKDDKRKNIHGYTVSVSGWKELTGFHPSSFVPWALLALLPLNFILYTVGLITRRNPFQKLVTENGGSWAWHRSFGLLRGYSVLYHYCDIAIAIRREVRDGDGDGGPIGGRSLQGKEGRVPKVLTVWNIRLLQVYLSITISSVR